jgi:hypothetical protein
MDIMKLKSNWHAIAIKGCGGTLWYKLLPFPRIEHDLTYLLLEN